MQPDCFYSTHRALGAVCRRYRAGCRMACALLAALLLALVLPAPVMARGYGYRQAAKPARVANIASIRLDALPEVAQQVYHTIVSGGSLPYEKDGSVFGNRERILPQRKRGYYREYTVALPNASSRGARRIVCGGAATPPDVCYYSADHYNSFQKISP